MNLFIFNFKNTIKFIKLNFILLVIYTIINFSVRFALNIELSNSFRSEFDTSILSDEPYDFLSIGNSHGVHSIDFNYFGINGLNIARYGQPYRYDIEKLNYYNEFYNDATLLIIPVSFHSLCHDEENWLPHEIIYNSYFPLRGVANINTVRGYLERMGYNKTLMENSDYTPGSGEITPDNCDHKIGLSFLEEILKLHGSSVIITTPYLGEYLGAAEKFKDFYISIDRLSTLYDVTYIDYSRDIRFQDTKYFVNPTHLNSTGRRKFTQILLADLEELLNL